MEPDTIVNTLFGCQTEFRHCVGYCHRKGKYMTVKILKNKGCLGKQCKYLEKKEHQFWTDREILKAKKKANRA